MPKIGLRNIKTAVAVFICLMLNVLLIQIAGSNFARDMYTPFFAGIAAVYSMQANRSSSFRQARIRSVGSVIGGYFGMIVLLIFEAFLEPWALDVSGEAFAKFIQYIFVGLTIIIVIHITVLTKQTSATFITCLTFLSVTVSIRNGGLPAAIFATNRILSTLIGVFISLGVNSLRLPHHCNDNILFVCGLDGTLLDSNKEINGFVRYKLNHLIRQGANITIATTRTPASLIQILDGIGFNIPLIIMNGAALFDIKQRKYINVVNICDEVCNELEKYFQSKEMNYFAHCIMDDVLYIYYQKIINEGEKRFYHERKNAYFKNYVRGHVPEDEHTVFYILIDHSEKILKLKEEIEKEAWINEVVLTCYKHEQFEGFHFLKIHAKGTSKLKAVHSIDQFKDKYTIAVGSREFDYSIIEQSDYSLTRSDADPQILEISTEVINGKTSNAVIKKMEKLYHFKRIDKLDK